MRNLVDLFKRVLAWDECRGWMTCGLDPLNDIESQGDDLNRRSCNHFTSVVKLNLKWVWFKKTDQTPVVFTTTQKYFCAFLKKDYKSSSLEIMSAHNQKSQYQYKRNAGIVRVSYCLGVIAFWQSRRFIGPMTNDSPSQVFSFVSATTIIIIKEQSFCATK